MLGRFVRNITWDIFYNLKMFTVEQERICVNRLSKGNLYGYWYWYWYMYKFCTSLRSTRSVGGRTAGHTVKCMVYAH